MVENVEVQVYPPLDRLANVEEVPQDYVLAHMWFNLAAQDIEKSVTNREIFTKKMPRADISLAQHLEHECLAQNYKNCRR